MHHRQITMELRSPYLPAGRQCFAMDRREPGEDRMRPEPEES
jgi:hypothetical protein